MYSWGKPRNKKAWNPRNKSSTEKKHRIQKKANSRKIVVQAQLAEMNKGLQEGQMSFFFFFFVFLSVVVVAVVVGFFVCFCFCFWENVFKQRKLQISQRCIFQQTLIMNL